MLVGMIGGICARRGNCASRGDFEWGEEHWRGNLRGRRFVLGGGNFFGGGVAGT